MGVVAIILIGLLIALIIINNNSSNKPGFTFKTITTTCEEFKVTGAIAYDS